MARKIKREDDPDKAADGIVAYSDEQLRAELTKREEKRAKEELARIERMEARTVTVKINRCARCPHVRSESAGSFYTNYFCSRIVGKDNKIVSYAERENETLIPDWCPLLKEQNPCLK